MNDEERLRVEAPEHYAAGLPGVIWSLRHIGRHVGLRRGARTLLQLNQPDGFDCPGCAWPEPPTTSRFEFCENGAKAVAEEATSARVDRAFFADHPISDLLGRSDHWLGQQGRLTEPMWRPPGADRYEPITWDAALDRISRQLQATTPERAVFYTSGRTSNEAAFAYQLFVRLFGTNNLPDCSNMCHESSGVALTETIGVGKGTVSLDDIYEAELLLIIGQNPGTNHPRMLIALEEAKRRGARVVAINPLPEAGLLRFKNPQRAAGLVGRGTAIADLFLPIRVGADLALFQLVNHLLVGRDAPGAPVLDHAFLTEHCDGLAELTEHLGELDADDLLAATGLERDDVDRLVDLVAGSDRIIACWAMGLTQHKGAVPTIREIVNTLLLRGSIGRPGAGACPVRGHSNVQGDRTMGIYEQPSDDFLDRLGAAVAFDPPREPGYDTVGAIEAMAEGRVDVFLAMGGNFVAAAPDTDVTSGRPGPLRADGADLHQAQPLAPVHGGGSAPPALPRPHRARHHRRSRAAGLRRGLDERRARLAGEERAGVTAPAQRGGDRLRPGRPHRRERGRGLGGAGRRLRPHPGSHRAGRAWLRGGERAGSGTGRVHPPQRTP